VNAGALGGRIRELRKQRGWSQQELGERLGVSPVAVSRWELGERQIKGEYLVRLARVFQVSLDELVQDENGELSLPTREGESVMPPREPTDPLEWREIIRTLADAVKNQSEAQKIQAQAHLVASEAQKIAQQNIQRALDQASAPLAPGRGGADAASGDE